MFSPVYFYTCKPSYYWWYIHNLVGEIGFTHVFCKIVRIDGN